MAERQAHGFNYQKKIVEREILTESVGYTDKWDAYNSNLKRNVSIKCISKKGSIDFGDFKRQTMVDEDFILYVGFWQSKKDNVVEEYKVYITAEKWKSYLGDITIIQEMLDEMSTISNDKSDDSKWKQFRLKWKERYGNSIISLRFKRDHKKQKRIQCGISRNNFLEVILKENQLL
jgi:hypothetical protein